MKSISLCYDLTRLEILEEARKRLMEKKQEEIENEGDYSEIEDDEKSRFHTIPQQVQFLNDCEIVLNKQFANDNSILFTLTHFVGSAFISFQYQHYREFILEQYEKDDEFLKFHGEYLKVEKASFPSDVYWKNIKYP